MCVQNMSEKCVTVLLGNKADLDEERLVKKEEIEEKAGEYGLKYFECSAKTGTNIKESLNYACEELLKLYKKPPKNNGEENSLSANKDIKNVNAISLSSADINKKAKPEAARDRCC